MDPLGEAALQAAHHVEAVAAGQDPQLFPFPAQHRQHCNKGLPSRHSAAAHAVPKSEQQ